MKIDKLATSAHGLFRRSGYFPTARAAFRAFLKAAELAPGERVLLPAYIGWSAREGSGVFDPITDLALEHRFYRMDERLEIDLKSLRECFVAGGVRVFVIIHYFGRVDPSYREAVAMAREFGALVLEDEAHAMLTDLIGGVAGRLGDAAVFSLHKLLPVSTGGMLTLAPETALGTDPLLEAETGPALWDFDLQAIAARRVENATVLRRLLQPLAGDVDPLWPAEEHGVVLQTFPVIVRRVSRDELYFRMNDAGFGVVSLYHTLISQTPPAEFPESHRLARHIMNLPVHHEADAASLSAMVGTLRTVIGELSAAGVSG